MEQEVSATYHELVNNAKRKLQFLDHQLNLLNMQKLPQEKLDGTPCPAYRAPGVPGGGPGCC